MRRGAQLLRLRRRECALGLSGRRIGVTRTRVAGTPLGVAIAPPLSMIAKTPMTRDVYVVPPELPLDAAWRIMTRERIRHLPVVRAGALFGMLSDRDILKRGTLDAAGHLHIPHGLLVRAAMTPTPLQTCDLTTQVAAIATAMIEMKLDAIPVVRGLHLVGLVTSTDLLQLLVDREEARVLPFDFRLREPLAATA